MNTPLQESKSGEMLFKAGPYISASQSRESTKDQEGAVRDVEGGLYKTILPLEY